MVDGWWWTDKSFYNHSPLQFCYVIMMSICEKYCKFHVQIRWHDSELLAAGLFPDLAELTLLQYDAIIILNYGK